MAADLEPGVALEVDVGQCCLALIVYDPGDVGETARPESWLPGEQRSASTSKIAQDLAIVRREVSGSALYSPASPLTRSHRRAAAAPSRAITTSSNRHRGGKLHWDDLQLERGHGGIAAYNQSKLAVNLLVREAARRHAGTGVSFHAVHPGAIATEIYRDLPWLVRKLIPVFTRTAAGGAAPLVHVATLPELPPSGTYWNRLRPETASAAARDDAAAARLWDLVKGLAGV